MNKDVQGKLVFINGILSDKLSPVWLGKWNTVFEAVGIVQTDKETVFKNSHYYVWSEVSKVHQDLIPYFSSEIQTAWADIYQFLSNSIGVLVEAENRKNEDARKVWDEAIKRVEAMGIPCVAIWSMDNPKNLDDKYPEAVEKVYYTNVSGWGHPGMKELPVEPTYFDVFKAVNELIHESGDTHHVFLEILYSVPKKPGSYVLSLGS